ncbi:MAG TPA: phage/plasmid primase, P4 family [Anaerolineaceae bacterium]|nr:phage/plasmid primase, P4 family [Anaerolineaceae bacterium]
MYELIPQELRELRQWVCWQGVPDEIRPGKIKKIPVNPATGGQAQSNNPDTWTSFEAAVAAAPKHSGVGFMFGNGIFGVDIDDVQDAIVDYRNGDDQNIVAEFIHTLQSYSEYSISGSGVHIICRGTLPPQGRRRKNVEMYSDGRFFIMTGNIAAEYTDIRDCTNDIKPLHEKYIGGGFNPQAVLQNIAQALDIPDDEVIRLAIASKQGQAFSALYSGNWESLFNSQSEADMSFCNMLAFWCRKDEAQMDRIFRSSGLMRDKWNRKQSGSTYGALTITKAVRSCTKVYEPKELYGVTFGSRPKPESKRYTFDDTGNADRMRDAFGDIIRYSFVAKRWLYYDGRRWLYDYEGAVRQMADVVIERMGAEADLYENEMSDQFAKHQKRSRSSNAKIAMLRETEHRVSILPDTLDRHTDLLNTPNGTLNLRTGELMPHDKNLYLTKLSMVEYTDKTDCPIWDDFLNTVFDGNKELIRYIQKAVGYSLTGSTREQCAFFLYGDGRNGKSTFLDTVGDIMGDYAVNVQPETLMVKHNTGGPSGDIARLKGARFVTSVEPSDGMRLNEGLIKQLTGGDRVTAAKKYENEFEFKTEFKLWMGMNYRPIIRGTDDGIWRRIHLVPFTVRIPDEKVDKLLRFKLRREMPGILKWAVDGCLLWQREGLEMPRCVLEAVKDYRSKMDVVGAFIDDCCYVGVGSETASTLFKAYLQWARENNEYEMTSTKFGVELSRRFSKVKEGGFMRYAGLRLNADRKPYSVTFKSMGLEG